MHLLTFNRVRNYHAHVTYYVFIVTISENHIQHTGRHTVANNCQTRIGFGSVGKVNECISKSRFYLVNHISIL